MELIDTHVHLLYPESFTYEWCANSPVLNRAFRIEDYRAAAKEAGGINVASLIFMEADVPFLQQAAETEFFSRMADHDHGVPALEVVIAAAWPESAKFSARLEQLARNGRVRGVRRVLHTMPEDLMESPRFAENVRLLPKFGFSFDLCLRPHLIPLATALAARCPETQFVLDHCGVPDVAGKKFEPWSGQVRALAKLPNVACKFSGLASCCDPTQPMTSQVRPYFEHCLECFGPRRLMWGSDWPVCDLTFDLRAWLETTAELLAGLGADDRAEIATRTADRVYCLS